MHIFVVIPLHNEEKHIVNVIKGVSAFKLPIVVVDDGSTDSSVQKLQEECITSWTKTPKLQILRHKVNLGKGAAMKTGAEYAFANGADAIIFMDSDGQHSARDLNGFINKLNSGKIDMVLGSRSFGMKMPLIRFLGNKVASLIVSLLFGIYISDILCGFRGMTKNAYKKVKWESLGYGVESEILARTAKANLKIAEIPVETIYHDAVKGVTILDSFGVFAEVVKWRLTI